MVVVLVMVEVSSVKVVGGVMVVVVGWETVVVS